MRPSPNVHWNPPRIAIVLYQNDDVLLFRDRSRPIWHFPSAAFDSEHSTVETAAIHEMQQRFAATIRPVRILAVNADFTPRDDERAQATIFLLAEAMSETRDTRPGEQLRSYNEHGLRELEEKKQLALDVRPVWDACQTAVYDEQHPDKRGKRR